MATHVQPHTQAPFQGVPQQQQNAGPLRHAQQPVQNGAKQPLQPSQGFPNLFARGDPLFDPQMTLWTIQKPISAESWENVEPQQQHVPLHELQEDVATFRRQKKSIKDQLMNMKSETAKRVVNELVEEENEKLWEINPTLQWTIGCIDIQRDIIKEWPNKGKKKLRSVEVILKTEPRAMADKPRGAFGAQDAARMKGGAMSGDPFQSQGANGKQGGTQMPKGGQNVGQGMGQNQHGGAQQFQGEQLRMPPGQGHGQGQIHGQGQGQGHLVQGGHIPPPPPPPGGQGHGPQGPVIPPPPSVFNGPPKQPHMVQPQHNAHQQPRGMPGAYPEPVVVPGPKHGQPHMQPIQVIDPPFRTLKKHKSKSQNFREYSESDSDSDSGSSGDDSRYSSRSVEDGAYGFIERSRSRGRGGAARSRSHSRARSRSHGRDRVSKAYRDKKSHRGSRSDMEPPPLGRHSSSHKNSSPRSSTGGLPAQQIFNIRIDNDNDKERERNQACGREHESFNRDPRRSSQSISPTGFSNIRYKKTEKYAAEPMSRNSSLGGSDTGSSFVDGNSSIYSAADGSVFSEPHHSRMHSRAPSEAGGHPRSRPIPRTRHDSFTQPSFTDFHHRAERRYTANDYPHQRPRGGYFDEHIDPPHRPSFSRRRSAQVANPFDAARYPPQRSLSYADVPLDPRGDDYPYPPAHAASQRTITDREQSPLDLHELADALEHIRETKQRHFAGAGRRSSVRGRMGMPAGGMAMDTDEWANPRYERGYSRYP